jgi:hypothetical protein
MSRQFGSIPLSIVALSFIVAACDSSSPDGGGGPERQGQLQVAHASAATGPIDVEVDGAIVVSGLAYGGTSAVVDVPAGSRQFTVRSGATVVGDMQHDVATDQLNNLVLSGGFIQFSDSIVPDTGLPIPTKANLRLVNVVGPTSAPPTLLEVLIQAPNANPDSVVHSNIDATIATYWSLMYFDPGSFNVRYVPQGDTVTLASASFDVAAGEKKQVILSRDAGGNYSVEVITEP